MHTVPLGEAQRGTIRDCRNANFSPAKLSNIKGEVAGSDAAATGVSAKIPAQPSSIPGFAVPVIGLFAKDRGCRLIALASDLL